MHLLVNITEIITDVCELFISDQIILVMVYANAHLIFLWIFQHEWWKLKQYAVPASASSGTLEGGGNKSCYPERKHGECLA